MLQANGYVFPSILCDSNHEQKVVRVGFLGIGKPIFLTNSMVLPWLRLLRQLKLAAARRDLG